MATISWQKLWDKHPYPVQPCDPSFANQCAIRMSVALRGAGVDLAPFKGAYCWHGHKPRHVLRAEELAKWLATRKDLVGTVAKHRRVTNADFAGKKGIVFIKDGWPAGGDHIDVWDGTDLKGGDPDWFAKGQEVWFWKLA